jgi:hypothetical protein
MRANGTKCGEKNAPVFYCNVCDYSTVRSRDFNRHLSTPYHQKRNFKNAPQKMLEIKSDEESEDLVCKEIIESEEEIMIRKQMELKSGANAAQISTATYACDCCEYETLRRDDFHRHLSSEKHKKNEIAHLTCDVCNKQFSTRSGLWKHRDLCHKSEMQVEEQSGITNNMFLSNQKMMFDYLSKKDEELKSLILDLVKTNQSAMMASNNTNSNNTTNNTMTNSQNSFNLNVFLNETCKDALNLSEFIDTVKIEISDIENMGKQGYVHGVSDVILRSLKNLKVEKRPIHCTDAKRETMYVKEDNKWEKEEKAREYLQILIDEVQKKNIRELPKWKEIYPTCLLSNSAYADTYNIICHEMMGGDCRTVKLAAKDEKIMKKIAKEVLIDKSMNYLK